MTHARRQPRGAHPPSDRLAEPRLLRRGRRCDKEMERVFDICHGCRRCVSLCNAFPTLFDLVDESRRRRGRRRRQEGLLEGRRPVLPVRPVLHDEVPVRAAAPVERRLPAPDAARQGDQVQQRRGRRRREAAGRRPTRTASSPASRSSCRSSTRSTGPKPARKLHATRRSACTPTPGCRRYATQRFRWTRAEAARATPVTRRRAHAGQGRDLRHLLRQLQRARHRPRPRSSCSSTTRSRTCWSRRKRAAACRSSSSATSRRVAKLQGGQHPACSRATRARATRS